MLELTVKWWGSRANYSAKYAISDGCSTVVLKLGKWFGFGSDGMDVSHMAGDYF